MVRPKGTLLVNLTALAFICIALPLIGVVWSGGPLEPYLRLPPQASPMNYPSFHPAALVAFALFILLVGFLWFRGSPPAVRHEAATATPWQRGFPWWGWGCLTAGAGAWLLAWTRFDWFAPLQPYTFIPQWLAYIGTINALTYARRGGCTILADPGFFLQLFPLSAVFWWTFEYLNRFVNNWIYAGAKTGDHPAAYILFATLAFATVIPGVFSTKELLGAFRTQQRMPVGGALIWLPRARAFYILPLILTAAAFFLSVVVRDCSIRSCGSARCWPGGRCSA